jgi:N-6 DNA Methylase
VNYAALGVEEFGSAYESLLDFHPLVELDPIPRFDLVTGSERKQTGSYYTPPSLVAELIKSALTPVTQDRLAGVETWETKETALLNLRVVDPASGSGHFLLAAARAIARELARVRLHGDEPSPPQFRQALRDVVRNCIYAVDKNPLAVDLCKVALWIEGYNAGLPLSFLDNHIKNGDSLVGVIDLECLADGIPDRAYAPVTGDDRAVATSIKKQNKQEREGQIGFWSGIDIPDTVELAARFRELGLAQESTPHDVHAKERAYEGLRSQGSPWWHDKVACDLWTAAFFVPLKHRENVPTTDTVRQYLRVWLIPPVIEQPHQRGVRGLRVLRV